MDYIRFFYLYFSTIARNLKLTGEINFFCVLAIQWHGFSSILDGFYQQHRALSPIHLFLA